MPADGSGIYSHYDKSCDAGQARITLEQAIAILQALKGHPGYWYWPITMESWVTLTARFAARIFGHQQITDAYLLGLAIKENGVLVTFDRGIKYMAGREFSRNVLVLE